MRNIRWYRLIGLLLGVSIVACGGPPGLRGTPGLTGDAGATGAGGEAGAVGATGSGGMQVTAVQLCPPSFVPTYPNVFPEYALCVSRQLYGVYSANGGFLALLPPGQYSSNGVNASCTFTIGLDCSVTD